MLLGSSPLSRGIHPAAPGLDTWGGIIPALAGNTSGGLILSSAATDHPRSRGEYAPTRAPASSQCGSSPLSRGIPDLCSGMHARWRIIPALAGNTLLLAPLLLLDTDHPRSRGEYPPPGDREARDEGSSPLSRGIRRGSLLYAVLYGIIPALAGNTPPRRVAPAGGWDHPRSRGEYRSLSSQRSCWEGSSPLSRGIRGSFAVPVLLIRIIPALAGNTESRRSTPRHRWDHPRSRGEYHATQRRRWPVRGSSPLSRGIPAPAWARADLLRIIPALAGNTRDLGCGAAEGADHPRSRGEYAPMELENLCVWGSSPLSRGIQGGRGTRLAARRIIPALAGNTRQACERLGTV